MKNSQTLIIKQKRFSFFRLFLVLVVIGVFSVGGYYSYKYWQAKLANEKNKPWFAGYVDVTATPLYPFQNLGSTSNKDAVLSFVVSSQNDTCIPSWGGAYTIDQANNSLDLNTRIARLQQQGGSIAISFGGKDNSELSVNCDDQTKLLQAYSSILNEYNVSTIDFDIEGSALDDKTSQIRRAQVISKLQSERRKSGKNLAIWLTLPVSPNGLTQNGTDAVSYMLSNGVDLSGVNIMTMDYGSLPNGQSMIEVSENALNQTEKQLSIVYKQHGTYLSDASVWAKIGATPMIGQNDDSDEVFTLNDAQQLNQFALSKGIKRISMWSSNRDITCGSNYTDIQTVSDSCSGIDQGKQSFASILGQGFDGSIMLSESIVTQSSTSQKTLTDNPATSPYQIWSETGAYPEGTKVVWHHNIYKAKWWTQGDMPDNPVLQSWQTPWDLIGPVLPGETPIPLPTLPEGTYPDWTSDAVYNTGQRILYNGVPYQAKWWNQGETPSNAQSDPSNSPWAELGQDQIDAILSSK